MCVGRGDVLGLEASNVSIVLVIGSRSHHHVLVRRQSRILVVGSDLNSQLGPGVLIVSCQEDLHLVVRAESVDRSELG